MQIILIENIPNLGNSGSLINVKSGYARNFLIPSGKAILATKENIRYFKERHIQIEAKKAEILLAAKTKIEQINAIKSITIKSKAGSTGRLFGSIGIRDIAKFITSLGIKITKNEVILPDGALRTIGAHEVNLKFHKNLITKLIVNIIAE